MSRTAQLIQLIDSDREFTSYFCAALIECYRQTQPGKARDEQLLALFAGWTDKDGKEHAGYIGNLSVDGLPKMVNAHWLDFATTVIECLPERERGQVWEWLALPENEVVMRDLKEFLEPTLAKLKYGYEKMQNGGLPLLKSVPA